MKLSTLSRKKRWSLYFVFSYALLAIVYFTTVSYVNEQLEARTPQAIYNECFKIWATRGLVTEGDLGLASSGNSTRTVLLAFEYGAKGSEIDVFYDPKLDQYILSHDFPYNLKDNKLLTLEELLENVGNDHFIWLDLKKLGRLTEEQVKKGVQRLSKITENKSVRNKIYIEGEDPFNLGIFRDGGFNTLFDTQPLPEEMLLSTFVINIYKMAYYFGDFTVMGMNSGNVESPIYGSNAESLLKDIPLFLYHVPDNEEHLKRLSKIVNVRVILNEDHSVNRFYIDACVE